ncbi:MAG TPA: sugar transferase [Candidatus Acidoferrales bacterium]|nr:sugar transferase [Candidatus Acidoferrales bacterium]
MSVSHSTFETEAPPRNISAREPLLPQGNRTLYCRFGKRALDLLMAGVGLLLLSPLFLLIALLVRITSGGQILHRENRVGRDAGIFQILEFRTTALDTERDGWALTIDDNEQVTWLGQILRKLNLDQMPQLWNVLRGDMSIVGPRPEIPSYVAMYTRQQLRVLTVRPGMADMASVRPRHQVLVPTRAVGGDEFYRREVLPERLLLNLEYIDRASLRLDLKLMAQSASSILRHNRAQVRQL